MNTEKSMTTPVTSEVAVLDEQTGSTQALPDFSSEAYKDAYSRINAIVIEGEQEAHDNYISLGTLAVGILVSLAGKVGESLGGPSLLV